MGKSAYVVELSVQPGGARRGELHVCVTYEQVRKILEWELIGDRDRVAMAADLAIFYGETIGVWAVIDGVAESFLDLHAFLRARVEGSAPIALDDQDAIDALAALREEEGKDFVEEAVFEIDWKGIEKALPRLSGDVVAPGEEIEVERAKTLAKIESYLSIAETLAFGWNDLEGGDEGPEDFPIR